MSTETILKAMPLIETERFWLRELRLSDAEDFFANLSDEETMRYYGMTPLTELETAVEMIKSRELARQENRSLRWAIARKEDDRLIGSIGFHHWEPQTFRAEIGYEINREYWGTGVATEAVRAALHCGFGEMGLNRIEALASPENPASIRVLEKAGFQKEGVLKEYMYFHDRFHDAVMLALLKREYQA
ncbi:ribosomal-protein-alanine N-acetyltransferase [Tumebacillus sp. BK434]|uniref:GNAT family N-acetyltransferase n=1 Tax=Tumebacillus sp. BK434 TaxID=2512169 RepID=UPI0010DEF81C|nr:GNAT family N-acetyltransferase [Tumebacillus sp. BK434]TCP55483.1 ribosomal-protein-alanine N-acetyltransferase [Tumebacillus sp. BK434]